MVKRLWWRIRHRKSRSETVAFAMGIEVGRVFGSMSREEVDEIKTRIKDGYSA